MKVPRLDLGSEPRQKLEGARCSAQVGAGGSRQERRITQREPRG